MGLKEEIGEFNMIKKTTSLPPINLGCVRLTITVKQNGRPDALPIPDCTVEFDLSAQVIIKKTDINGVAYLDLNTLLPVNPKPKTRSKDYLVVNGTIKVTVSGPSQLRSKNTKPAFLTQIYLTNGITDNTTIVIVLQNCNSLGK